MYYTATHSYGAVLTFQNPPWAPHEGECNYFPASSLILGSDYIATDQQYQAAMTASQQYLVRLVQAGMPNGQEPPRAQPIDATPLAQVLVFDQSIVLSSRILMY